MKFLENKAARKGIINLADDPADYDKLVEMLRSGTKMEIIKQATAEELVEGNKSWWQRNVIDRMKPYKDE